VLQTREAIVLAAAIVVATIVGVFCFALSILTGADPWVAGPLTQPDWPLVLIAWFMGVVTMVPFAAIVGVPSYLLLRRFRLFRWWSVGLIGAAVGLVAKFMFRVVPAPSSVCFGALTALLAWALIVGANNSFQRTRCARR
jgi:hypothetical protein